MELLALPATAQVSDDESSDDEQEMDMEDDFLIREDGRHPDLPIDATVACKDITDFQQKVTDVFMEGKNTKIETNDLLEHDYSRFNTPSADMLPWHYQFGHPPFARIVHMARRLMKRKVPVCAACAYGKATQRPWRTKAPQKAIKAPPSNALGAVV
jgi:hypothetical protein